MGEQKAGFGKFMSLTFLIGFGFFTMGLMDPLYDTYLPIFLGKHISSMALVGALMALDNILAILLIPVVTVWSDRVRTPLGRRMPFIVVLLPLSAACFAFLPYAAAALLPLLLAVFLLNIFKQAARGPVVALMPDLIPGDFRSEANGVINTMGGIGSIVGTLALGPLMNVVAVLPVIGQTKDRLPFPIAGVMVFLAAVLLIVLIRENRLSAAAGNRPAEKPEPFFASAREVWKGGGSALLILVSLFLWMLGYQGVLPFIGKYANETLGLSKGWASLGAGAVGVAYAIFAIPSGYVAHRLGRKRVLRASLLGLTAMPLALLAFDFLFRRGALPLGVGFPLYLGMLFVFGIFWVSVVTNSFPMLWQMATQDTMGIYTGLYYTFSQLASILAPVLTGVLIDAIRSSAEPGKALADIPATVGYPGMFLFCSACMLAAFFTMRGVRGGEAEEA